MPSALAPDPALLSSALGGDEGAFERLVTPYRGELRAHCYRMLGSLHDAEDALQEAMIRAWRYLKNLKEGTSLRSWLYKIATNTCLDAIAKRPKRVLPVDYGPSADPHDVVPGEPLAESVWIEPYPDEIAGLEDVETSPEASFEQTEALELAFIAALQFLPPNQRAALIQREVLGFSAKEVAESLDTSVPSVNSALQRARKTLDDKMPEQSQQETLRSLGDEKLTEVVEGYMEAMRGADVDRVLELLADDAAWAMPPSPSWYTGDDLPGFLRAGPLSGDWKWKHVATRANGQPAIASYTWNGDAGAYLPFALDVLTVNGNGKIREICSFITRTSDIDDPAEFNNWPEYEQDETRLRGVYESFGLPSQLD